LAFHTLVLGIGNTLLSDEGVGVHALHYLAGHHPLPPHVELLDGGTLSFTLAGPVAAADGLIVVDAARLDAAPGTVRLFEGEAMDTFVKGSHGSVHEVGLSDLLDMVRLSGDLTRYRCLIGIQPRELGWGEQPTPEVAAALPEAAALVLETIGRWSGDPPAV
jgi:hydrogenase maturation protease